jgi:hypothetical protein
MPKEINEGALSRITPVVKQLAGRWLLPPHSAFAAATALTASAGSF